MYLKILKSNDIKHRAVQEKLENMNFLHQNILTNTFEANQKEYLRHDQLESFDQFLSEFYKVSTSEKLKAEINRLRSVLMEMEGKDLKSSILDYDRDKLNDSELSQNIFNINLPMKIRLLGRSEDMSTLQLILMKDANVKMEITNISSQKLMIIDEGLYLSGTTNILIDKSQLLSGIYMVHVSNKDRKIINESFAVQR